MSQRQRYRILYFQGDEITSSTKMLSGRAYITDGELRIEGVSSFSLPLATIRDVDLYRHKGLGRMIRFRSGADQYFVTVVRLQLFGSFAIVNFFATGKFFRQLSAGSETS